MNTIRSPFKFLDAFELKDREVFYGRDNEIEQLYNLVFKTPLLLIYGASGTGKTSLIQCGLASKFDGTDWLPLWIRRDIDINTSMQLAINKVLPNNENTEGSITDNIQRLYQHYLRPVFLIFDQFEELFIFGTKEERDLFIDEIKIILDKELPCNIIIAIREEYLGQLYPLEKEIPELFDFRMRVEAMDASHVKEVLDNSFQKFNITVEQPKDKRFEQIIENVSRGKSGIELPYLQVYLDKLYREDFERTYPDEINTQNTEGVWLPLEFTEKEISEFGSIDNVLDKFLDEQQSRIQEQLNQKDSSLKNDTVRLILDAFVSDEGTKRPIRYTREYDLVKLEPIEQKYFPNVSTSMLTICLTEIENARLIRSDGTTMELAHDSLAALIDKRRTNEQRLRNDIKRQIRSMYQNFPRTYEYLTQKQINVFEDVLAELDLEAELILFFKESQKFRAKEADEELQKEKQRNEELQKALNEAEQQTQISNNLKVEAEGNYNRAEEYAKRAEAESIIARKNAKRASNFSVFALISLVFAGFLYYIANITNQKLKQSSIELIKERDNAKESLRKFEEAQKANEMTEFKITLQNVKGILKGNNCPPKILKQNIENMKTKYPNDVDLQKEINQVLSELSKCN
jgi:hypothetical protein